MKRSSLPFGAGREIQRRLALAGTERSSGHISLVLAGVRPDDAVLEVAAILKAQKWARHYRKPPKKKILVEKA